MWTISCSKTIEREVGYTSRRYVSLRVGEPRLLGSFKVLLCRIVNSGEEGKAKKKENLAERKLRLAEERLKTAELNNLGERIERAAWIRLFQDEVERVKIPLDELQRLAEDTRRDVMPYRICIHAKLNDNRREEDNTETESLEFKNQLKKRDELNPKAHEARRRRDRVKEEVDFVKEGLTEQNLDTVFVSDNEDHGSKKAPQTKNSKSSRSKRKQKALTQQNFDNAFMSDHEHLDSNKAPGLESSKSCKSQGNRRGAIQQNSNDTPIPSNNKDLHAERDPQTKNLKLFKSKGKQRALTHKGLRSYYLIYLKHRTLINLRIIKSLVFRHTQFPKVKDSVIIQIDFLQTQKI